MTVRSDAEHDDRPARLADMNSSESPGDGKWLSIHEACRLLGVDQSTLRRWSDSGKVPVFRTPGGHRRYAESELLALVGNGSRRFERQRVMARQLADQSRAGFVDEFWRTARTRRWYRAYSPNQLEDLRRLGRRLIDLAVRYASTAAGPERQSLIDEGRSIGHQYARVGAMAGLSGAEAVEAFLYFRAPVVHSLTSLTEGSRMGAPAMLRVSAEVNSFLDQVLLAMVHEHEEQSRLTAGATIQPGIEGQFLDDL
ncbi:MAG TPA: helix-turn-helix domain-containing protein [Thermomicrobiales bacterium]|nr:helix-turn-helix domain-containing protein [Thermomicrobiales bacterium]